MTINRAGNDVVRHLALLRRLLVALVLLVQGPASPKNLHRRRGRGQQLLLSAASAASASVRWWPLAVPCVLLAVVLPRYGGHCYAKNEKESFGEFVNALMLFGLLISFSVLGFQKKRPLFCRPASESI